jgi:hypothetical protein
MYDVAFEELQVTIQAMLDTIHTVEDPEELTSWMQQRNQDIPMQNGSELHTFRHLLLSLRLHRNTLHC